LRIEQEQPRPAFWRHPRSALLALLALAVVVASAPLFLAPDATWLLAWSNGCMVVIVTTTALRCLATTRRLRGTEKTAWRFISLAYLSFVLAQVIWSTYELVLGIPNPMPAPSDVGYLIAPLLLMVGIWLYRTTAPTLSMLIVQLGNVGILLAAIFLANTIVFQHRIDEVGSLMVSELLIVYAAVAMTAFIFALFNIFFYMRGGRRLVMTPLLLALGSLALSDYISNFEFASGNSISISYVSIGYFVTFAFGYWAAFEQDQRAASHIEEQDVQTVDEAALQWETLLVPFALAGLIVIALTHREYLTSDLAPNAAGALLLFSAAIATRDWWSRRIEVQLRDGTRTAAAALQKSERHLLAKNDELEATNRELSKEMTARLQIQGELRHSQKMEAIGQLTGGVAHDFNNLLAVIVGNVDLLEETLEPGSSQRVFTREAIAAANRGASLTDRLLAFSRKQALDPRPVGVNDLLKSMTGLLERSLGETIQLRFEMSASTAPCMIDRAQLENAILNLALNARDAMSSSGLITIETSNVTLNAHDVAQHPDASAGDYVSIAVSDTGAGMSDQVQARVFEPFFTTKDVGLGSGLGLSMVYGFVIQSGGHVSIESTEESGTEVRLYIPRTNLLPDPIEDIDVGAAPAGQGESVLVVEDDPAVRTVVVSFLEQQNYQVIAAADGSEALAILDDRGPFDLLLSDVILPGEFSGTELANVIISRQPSMKILLMSGYASDAFEKTAGPSDDANLLQKPFSMGKLAREMRSVLDSEEGGLDSEEGGLDSEEGGDPVSD
jgi:signal transduction histidine kinase/ActR/RegA family two-component response regulator